MRFCSTPRSIQVVVGMTATYSFFFLMTRFLHLDILVFAIFGGDKVIKNYLVKISAKKVMMSLNKNRECGTSLMITNFSFLM